jgi:hypothetical protein
MDWLESHWVVLDCRSNTLHFVNDEGQSDGSPRGKETCFPETYFSIVVETEVSEKYVKCML